MTSAATSAFARSPFSSSQPSCAAWLADIQRYLPAPDLTIVLDIAPDTAVQRKSTNRDRYERDLAMLSRVRESYRRQGLQPGWLVLNGERGKGDVSADIVTAVAPLLARP